MKRGLPILLLGATCLAGCASTGSNPVADMPAWMGGLPAERSSEARNPSL